jgi:hypothetical protein
MSCNPKPTIAQIIVNKENIALLKGQFISICKKEKYVKLQ